MADAPHRLDVRGALCPLPVLLSVREIRKVAPGELLEVWGDDPTMNEDMPIWCERSGHTLLEIGEIEGIPGTVRCLIERGQPDRP